MSSTRLQTTIENPTLELKIISACDVSYIDATEKMDVYAIVSLKDDYTQKKQAAKTPIDYDGGSNPTWNHTIKFSFSEKAACEGLLTIHVKLFSYWLEGENDLYLGEVNVSVRELLASNPLPPFANGVGNVNKMKLVTYPLSFIGETKPNAKLSLSYRFKPVKDLYPPMPDYSSPFGQPIYPNPDPTGSCQPVIYSPQQLQTTTVTKLALQLVIKCAKDIKKVNVFDEMHVYASVTIREGKQTVNHRSDTPIAFSAYQNPKWNHAVNFSLDEALARDGRLLLLVELMSHRPILGDKHIGEVNVSIQDLLRLYPPLTKGDGNDMMLVTEGVSTSSGKKGTLTFAYRFITEQVTVSKPPPSTNPQPFIMYVPVSHQGASGYAAVHPGAHDGSSNGLVPIGMAPPYQSHEYYSPHQPQPHTHQQQQYQLPPQKFQSAPLYDTQPHSYQSYGNQQYPPPERLPQYQPDMPLQQQAQAQAQTEGARPQVKPQGGTIAAIGVGASVLGRVIGGALISDMMSGEANIYEGAA
ncbi:C2 domain-containing protein [Hirschfeldia incana]|nr:C2 domain-containing protein [Hirschfeldia incana]